MANPRKPSLLRGRDDIKKIIPGETDYDLAQFDTDGWEETYHHRTQRERKKDHREWLERIGEDGRLSLAILRGGIEGVEKHLAGDIDRELDASGTTALHRATRESNHDLVKYLVDEKGAKVNWPGPLDGSMAIHYAVEQDDCEMAKLLVERGADVDAYADSRRAELNGTPLAFAVSSEMVEILLKAGADPNCGYPCLHWGGRVWCRWAIRSQHNNDHQTTGCPIERQENRDLIYTLLSTSWSLGTEVDLFAAGTPKLARIPAVF